MKISIINSLLGIALILSACSKAEQPTADKQPLPEQEISEDKTLQDLAIAHKLTLAQMIDSAAGETEDFSDTFKGFLLSDQGVQEVSESKALEQFEQVLDSPKKSLDLPFFEVINTDSVILLAKGRGVTALILVDKPQLTIQKLVFLANSQTEKLGSRNQDLQAQFAGTTITFSPNNFGIKPWDEPKFQGDVQIDGISGATDICQSALDMLNEQLPRYQAYFTAE